MLKWTIHPDDIITCEGPRCREWHRGHDEDEFKDGDSIIKLYENGAEELAIVGQGRLRIIYSTGDIVHLDEEDRVVMIITHDGKLLNCAGKNG